MEIKAVEIIQYYHIEIIENGNTDYYRRSIDSDSWEVLMGDSWENLLLSTELEAAFRSWQAESPRRSPSGASGKTLSPY